MKWSKSLIKEIECVTQVWPQDFESFSCIPEKPYQELLSEPLFSYLELGKEVNVMHKVVSKMKQRGLQVDNDRHSKLTWRANFLAHAASRTRCSRPRSGLTSKTSTEKAKQANANQIGIEEICKRSCSSLLYWFYLCLRFIFLAKICFSKPEDSSVYKKFDVKMLIHDKMCHEIVKILLWNRQTWAQERCLNPIVNVSLKKYSGIFVPRRTHFAIPRKVALPTSKFSMSTNSVYTFNRSKQF